jgi:hypothetical protein
MKKVIARPETRSMLKTGNSPDKETDAGPETSPAARL